MIRTFKDLIVWQEAMELVVEIYKITRQFPKSEIYGLSSQMQRAAVSIPSNIAEGNQRNSIPQYLQFVSIARGSLGELETQIMLSHKLEYLDKKTQDKVILQTEKIGRLMGGLMKSLKTKT
ncbi:MAG: four helix bundle protein [Flexibacter sp. CG_4_10_14_3_um_filter_32_15]|nr:MAG: four helix bundle protein [Flexibacter sp. CG_4_10_14_3_um_filter_32_15]